MIRTAGDDDFFVCANITCGIEIEHAAPGDPAAAFLTDRDAPTDCRTEPSYPAHETAIVNVPDSGMTVHEPQPACSIEAPHAIADCAWFGVRPIVVVCGFARTGSSLVMSMLHAGGIDVYAENTQSYEHLDVLGLPDGRDAFLAECCGRALKVLEPQHCRLPEGVHAYRFIWLERSPLEQARSNLKFMREIFHMSVDDISIDDLVASYEQDRPVVRAMLEAYPDSRVLPLQFEDVLSTPFGVATQIAEFLAPEFTGLDVSAMVARVRRRSPECMEGFLELEMMAEDIQDRARVIG